MRQKNEEDCGQYDEHFEGSEVRHLYGFCTVYTRSIEILENQIATFLFAGIDGVGVREVLLLDSPVLIGHTAHREPERVS